MKSPEAPPRFAKWILAWLQYYSETHLMQGDFDDEFRLRSLANERPGAVLWYWGQVLYALLANAKRKISSGGVMLRNYVTITSRIIRRHKLFSFINIAGLAAGIACCILISVWVRHEQGVNRFHEKIDRLYLVRDRILAGDAKQEISGTPPMLGPALLSEYPEVLGMARLFNWQPELLMKSGDDVFRQKVQFSDPSLFDLFTFLIVKGEQPRESMGPSEMIISEELARRLFGARDPIGRNITIDNRVMMTVSGVMKDIPANSTLRFDAWAPLKTVTQVIGRPDFLNDWGNLAFRTYVELREGAVPESFSAKISGRINRANPSGSVEPFVYPFKDYYMKLLEQGKKVRMFSLIAILILLMACINFANLSTARSERRAKEVGIRKVAGARRSLLVRQFLGESVLYAILSLAVAVSVAVAFLPVFRKLTGLEIAAGTVWTAAPWPTILVMTLLAGLVSGIYPAFILSSLTPARTVKGDPQLVCGRGIFRKALVLVQFSLSILFIIGSVVISAQIRFMKTRNPGYSRDSVLYFPIQGEVAKSYSMVKTELLKNPAIEHISVVTDTPLYIGSIVVSGEWEGRNPNTNPQLTFFGVDHDFLATFDIDLVQGRFFGPDILPQSREVVINETLATLVGKKDVVGSQITSLDRTFNIIGVVKDFNFRPLDQYLEPLVMFHDDQIMPFRYMFVKVRPDGISRTIASLKDAGNRFKLDAPLEYKFLDEEAAAQYEAEERLRGLVSAFMALAIFISSLGLFGLSVFMVERRVREIGIRKILGASAFRVTALLSMNILKWVLVANAIAWPVGYLFMSRWLRNFAFHIDLNFWIFALSAGILFVIGIGTVSVQTLRAASANPARSLRHE